MYAMHILLMSFSIFYDSLSKRGESAQNYYFILCMMKHTLSSSITILSPLNSSFFLNINYDSNKEARKYYARELVIISRGSLIKYECSVAWLFLRLSVN